MGVMPLVPLLVLVVEPPLLVLVVESLAALALLLLPILELYVLAVDAAAA